MSIPFSKSSFKTVIAIALVAFGYLAVRLPGFSQWFNFADDQGQQLIEVRETLLQKKLPLIGPAVLTLPVNDKYFFHGPYEYYWLLPIFWLSQGHPVWLSLWVVIVNLLAALLMWWILNKYLNFGWSVLVSVTFFSLPTVIHLTTFIWNPTLLWLWAMVWAATIFRAEKFSTVLRGGLAGLAIGVAISTHYQAGVWLMINLQILIWRRRISEFLAFGLALTVASLPMIIFELRHNFYNLRLMWELIVATGDTASSFNPAISYYWLGLMPVAIILAISWINKFQQTRWLALLVPLCLWAVVQQFKLVSSWEQHWNYQYLQIATQIVNENHDGDFNLANLLTGDTRAQAWRYEVERRGLIPREKTDYAAAQQLFVLARTPQQLQQSPPWELTSFNGCVKKVWPIDKLGLFKVFELTKDC